MNMRYIITESQLLKVIKENNKGWNNSNSKLEKSFKFKDFKEAMNFVNKVGKIAESQNHHEVETW